MGAQQSSLSCHGNISIHTAPTLITLPTELLLEIGEYLDIDTLIAWSATCHRLRSVINYGDQFLYQRIIDQHKSRLRREVASMDFTDLPIDIAMRHFTKTYASPWFECAYPVAHPHHLNANPTFSEAYARANNQPLDIGTYYGVSNTVRTLVRLSRDFQLYHEKQKSSAHKRWCTFDAWSWIFLDGDEEERFGELVDSMLGRMNDKYFQPRLAHLGREELIAMVARIEKEPFRRRRVDPQEGKVERLPLLLQGDLLELPARVSGFEVVLAFDRRSERVRRVVRRFRLLGTRLGKAKAAVVLGEARLIWT